MFEILKVSFKNENSQLTFYYISIHHAFYVCFFKKRKIFIWPRLLELTVLYFPSIEGFTKRHYFHNLQDFWGRF